MKIGLPVDNSDAPTEKSEAGVLPCVGLKRRYTQVLQYFLQFVP